MGSDPGLSLGTPILLGPRKYWDRRLRFMERAKQNKQCSPEFPAELSFFFIFDLSSGGTSILYKLKYYIALLFFFFFDTV